MIENKFLRFLFDWSEVWALLIPLATLIIYKPGGKQNRILVSYVLIGLALNSAAIFVQEFYELVPKWAYINNMPNNNIFYNTHSIVRVLFFGLYVITVREYPFSAILKIVLAIYLLCVFYIFYFIEGEYLYLLSTRLFAAESIILLVICFFYFLRSIQDDSQTNWLKHPSFLVCAGISLYEVITFFIFLFFYPLVEKDPRFFLVTMEIYHIAFVILCILLALAFYQSRKQSGKK